MLMHEIRTASLSNKKRRRVGRGQASGCGKTCGRGREGATSRSGWAMSPTYEGGQRSLFRRLPKRGFTNGPFRVEYTVVNLEDLAVFEAGATVGREQLKEKGLLAGRKGMPIKILGDGELKQGLTIVADRFSKSALEKIERAGGKVEWVNGKPKKRAPNFARIEKDARRNEALAKAKAEADATDGKGEKGNAAKKGGAEKGEGPEKADSKKKNKKQ